jgi:hypothetical protein
MLNWFEKQQILWSLPREERIKAILYGAQVRQQQREAQKLAKQEQQRRPA